MNYKDKHDFKLSELEIYTLDLPVNEKTDTHALLLRHVISKAEKSHKKLLICIAIDAMKSIRNSWMYQLVMWVDMIRVATRDMDLKEQMDSLRRHHQQYLSTENDGKDQNIEIPLAESQYNDPLGIDLLITLVGVESHVEQYGGDDSIDLAQQIIRLVALKHGGSVAYISGNRHNNTDDENFLSLVSEILEIPVRELTPEKCSPSVVDSDLISVPRGWDTKGKILALGNNFEFDKMGEAWSKLSRIDLLKLIQSLFPEDQSMLSESPEIPVASSIERIDWQKLLEEQYAVQEEKMREKKEESSLFQTNNDYNMAGIKVEGMNQVLRRLKQREQVIASEKNIAVSSPTRLTVDRDVASTDQNTILASFFQNLLDKNPGNS